MPHYGFDADNSGKAMCTVKLWEEKGILAGALLVAYGTVPHKHSVCLDCHTKALGITKALIQGCLEEVATGNGTKDLPFAATKVCDALKEANARTRGLAAFIGQGIYIGGVVIYLVGAQYFVTPFGGGAVYVWNGLELRRKGAPMIQDGLIRDAVGSQPVWQGDCWKGTLTPECRIICCSDILSDTEEPGNILRQNCAQTSHQHTIAMLIRRELEKTGNPPYAAMEFGL